MATVRRPSSWPVRKTRMAISPRLVTMSLRTGRSGGVSSGMAAGSFRRGRAAPRLLSDGIRPGTISGKSGGEMPPRRNRAPPMMRYFATCGRGIEPVLAGELRALGARDVAEGRGGVSFAGGKALLYKASLWLRTAVRVLVPVLEATVTSPDELYEAVRGVDWSRYLTPDHTLAVDCNVRDSALTHSRFAALRTKDAICDQFVERRGRRPSVDVEQPMVKLNLHVHKNAAVLSLDS